MTPVGVSDYEYLYMIRQNDQDSMDTVLGNYRSLLWKRAHDFMNSMTPKGVSVDDMFQEGAIGFHEAVYSFMESMNVGFAFYVSLCVESSIKTALRKCRGKSYLLLDSKSSLDMSISEDGNLYLGDIVESHDIKHNPRIMAQYYEAKKVETQVLDTLNDVEKEIYALKVDGYSYKEIADFTQTSVKFVDNIIQKIRRRLKLNVE